MKLVTLEGISRDGNCTVNKSAIDKKLSFQEDKIWNSCRDPKVPKKWRINNKWIESFGYGNPPHYSIMREPNFLSVIIMGGYPLIMTDNVGNTIIFGYDNVDGTSEGMRAEEGFSPNSYSALRQTGILYKGIESQYIQEWRRPREKDDGWLEQKTIPSLFIRAEWNTEQGGFNKYYLDKKILNEAIRLSKLAKRTQWNDHPPYYLMMWREMQGKSDIPYVYTLTNTEVTSWQHSWRAIVTTVLSVATAILSAIYPPAGTILALITIAVNYAIKIYDRINAGGAINFQDISDLAEVINQVANNPEGEKLFKSVGFDVKQFNHYVDKGSKLFQGIATKDYSIIASTFNIDDKGLLKLANDTYEGYKNKDYLRIYNSLSKATDMDFGKISLTVNQMINTNMIKSLLIDGRRILESARTKGAMYIGAIQDYCCNLINTAPIREISDTVNNIKDEIVGNCTDIVGLTTGNINAVLAMVNDIDIRDKYLQDVKTYGALINNALGDSYDSSLFHGITLDMMINRAKELPKMLLPPQIPVELRKQFQNEITMKTGCKVILPNEVGKKISQFDLEFV